MRNLKDHILNIHETKYVVFIWYISICGDVDLPGNGGWFLGAGGGVGGDGGSSDAGHGGLEDGHALHSLILDYLIAHPRLYVSIVFFTLNQ